MKGIFNPDSPFSQFMYRVADLCIVNVLMLVCCLPIVTIGASFAAAHKVMQDMVFDTGSSVVVPFFKAFKSNFKQATVVWLATLFFAVVLLAYAFLVMVYITGTTATVMYIILCIAVFIIMGLTAYLYPLMVRYENTLRQHLRNAVLVAILKFPRTVGMVLIYLAPVAIAFFFTPFFLQIGVFWLLMGFSFIILINSSIMKPIFDELEENKAAAAAKAAELTVMETAEETPKDAEITE